MSEVCPISFKQVDENAARINALLSAFTVVLFWVTSYKFIIVLLAVDFFIRGFIDPLYSFNTAISKSILRIKKSKPKLIDGSPKIFAAKLGFYMSISIVVLSIYDSQIIATIFGVLLIFFALLEGVLGYCVGCKIYTFIEKLKKTQS